MSNKSNPFKCKSLLWIGVALLFTSQAPAAPTKTPIAVNKRTGYQKGVVVSRSQIASDIGAEILQKGGNAFDAAVATGYALAVVNPKDSGIGGGGFALIYQAKTKTMSVIDFRETAPLTINQSAYSFLNGPRAVGIPGTIAGYEYLRKKFGKLDRNILLRPSIELAQDGFPVTSYFQEAISSNQKDFNQATRKVFLPKGKIPEVGQLITQPELANTLMTISNQGETAFYEGAIARQIDQGMRQQGGLIRLNDLQGYRIEEREPLCGSYRKSYKICTLPPPSAGGLVLIEALNILENFNLPKYDYNSPKRLHYVLEALKFGFADRATKVGDPAFNPVMVKELVSKDLARQRAIRIQEAGRATPSQEILPNTENDASEEEPETTHFTVTDREGNIAAITVSLNGPFGSGYTIPGTGILMNNTLDDFAKGRGESNQFGLVAGRLNLPYPRKRPLSSMTPTIVFDQASSQPILVLGSPGGPTIASAIVNVILAYTDQRMSLSEAVAAGRIHHQWIPDYVFGERSLLSPEIKAVLRDRYQYKFPPEELTLWRRFYWTVEAVSLDSKTGEAIGVSDSRAEQGLSYD